MESSACDCGKGRESSACANPVEQLLCARAKTALLYSTCKPATTTPSKFIEFYLRPCLFTTAPAPSEPCPSPFRAATVRQRAHTLSPTYKLENSSCRLITISLALSIPTTRT